MTLVRVVHRAKKLVMQFGELVPFGRDGQILSVCRTSDTNVGNGMIHTVFLTVPGSSTDGACVVLRFAETGEDGLQPRVSKWSQPLAELASVCPVKVVTNSSWWVSSLPCRVGSSLLPVRAYGSQVPRGTK